MATQRCKKGHRRYPPKTGQCISKEVLMTQPHGRYIKQKNRLVDEIDNLKEKIQDVNSKLKKAKFTANRREQRYRACKTAKRRR